MSTHNVHAHGIQNLSCTSSMSCAIFFSYSCLPHTKNLQLLNVTMQIDGQHERRLIS